MSVDVEPHRGGTATVRLPASRVAAGRGLARGRVWTLLIVDVLSIWLAFGLTYTSGTHLDAVPEFVASPALLAIVALASTAMWVGVFAAYGLYERQTRAIAPSSLDEIADLFHALLAGALVLLVVGQVVKTTLDSLIFSPIQASVFVGFTLMLIPLGRSSLRTWILPGVLRPRRTLIVGAGPEGRAVRRKLESNPSFSLDVLGFVDADSYEPDVLGSPCDVPMLVDVLEIEWVVMATNAEPTEEMLDIMRSLRRPDVHLSIVPSYAELFASNATLEEIQGIPVVSLPPMRLSRSIRTVKRAIDIIASGLGLLVLSPLLAMIALVIRLDSPGPIFFRQGRHGRGGKEFEIVKFRTMVAEAETLRMEMAHLNEMEGAGPLFKMARRSAHHHRRRLPAQDEPRRAPAAVERPPGRDVASSDRVRSWSTSPSRSRAGPAAGWTPPLASPASGRCSGATTSPSRRWSSSTTST